jgi:hypothetical protein
MRARLIDAGKWAALLAAFVLGGYFLHWNEYESPWGRDIQAAKTEMLRAKLCN